MRKSLKIVIPAAVLLAVIAAVFVVRYVKSDNDFEFREGEYGWELDYFGKDKYSELHEEISDSDKAELMSLYDEVDRAFSFVCKTDEEAKAEFGDYLYVYTANYTNADHETHKLRLLTGKVDGDEAVLWFSYLSRVYSAGGELLCGSGSENNPCKVRLEAEKRDGKWVVTDRMEHP